MKNFRYIVLIAVLVCLGILVTRLDHKASSEFEPTLAEEHTVEEHTQVEDSQPQQLLSGNSILEDHGKPEFTGQDDVLMVGQVVQRVVTLFKNTDTRYLATIEDFSAFVTGKNPEGLVYLDPGLPAFKDGVLTDRWGNPYMIHPLSVGMYEIRSIGPDGIPYNEDDWTMHPSRGVYSGVSVNPF